MANRYLVTLTDRPAPVTVDVKFPDMVVAETEAPRNGIADASLQPLAITQVWVWCALRRQGEHVGTFAEFRTILDDLENVKDEGPTLDPTQPVEHTG